MKTVVMSVLVLVVVACSSSRITTSWTTRDMVPRYYSKILVVSLIKDNDLELIRSMENHMVGDLKTHGYSAVSALDEYGPKAFNGMDEEKALEKIRGSGVDAVMTVVLLDKEQEKEYVPSRIYFTPYVYYHNRFWGYYTTMRTRIYEPGYYQENTRYFWESNFYSMSDGKKLLYSVQTKSFNPASTSSLAHEYGRLIIDNLVKKGVLAERQPALAAGGGND